MLAGRPGARGSAGRAVSHLSVKPRPHSDQPQPTNPTDASSNTGYKVIFRRVWEEDKGGERWGGWGQTVARVALGWSGGRGGLSVSQRGPLHRPDWMLQRGQAEMARWGKKETRLCALNGYSDTPGGWMVSKI